MSDTCIFCKIASKQIPVEALYEDANFIAFRDMNPQAPIHILIIPKVHIETIMELDSETLMTGAFRAVQATAQLLNLTAEGFRTVVNCRENGGQTVYHLHFHLLGGRFMQWPPG
ncbi:MAG: histidine triad nucleotide-binding protein [Armatimonadetes bacterium]|nr:histidine triad nucleotide-binding protein [Armatimonadota bacterium]